MSNSKIVYNEDHMTDIYNNYVNCSEEIGTILSCLFTDGGSAKSMVDTSYEGQGKDLALDIFIKLKEHLECLQTCYDRLGEYVTYSLDTMKEADGV